MYECLAWPTSSTSLTVRSIFTIYAVWSINTFYNSINSNVTKFYGWMHFQTPTQYGDGNQYFLKHLVVIANQGWRAIRVPMKWRLHFSRHQTGILRGFLGKVNLLPESSMSQNNLWKVHKSKLSKEMLQCKTF